MTDLDTASWLDIPGWEGLYQASSDGQIKSLERVVLYQKRAPRTFPSKILAQTVNPGGYKMVSLSRNGVRSVCYVHRLVALAFYGYPLDGQEVCHNNGDRLDNRFSNLRWDTRSGNFSDKLIHGTSNRGQNHGNAKLTEEQALAVLRSTETHAEIARRYDISTSSVYLIKRGTNWKHLSVGLQEGSEKGNRTIYVPTEGGLPVPTLGIEK